MYFELLSYAPNAIVFCFLSEEIVDSSASASGGEFMSDPKVQRVMSAANAFSCGVFAAMVVISMIPGPDIFLTEWGKNFTELFCFEATVAN